MALATTNYGQGVYNSSVDMQNLGNLMHVAEVQYQRQLKTLQALQKQAELTAEENAAWRHREQRRMEKYAAIDYERQQQAEHRAELATQVAENRAARMEAAAQHEEAMRAAAAAKVQAVEDRLARFASERAEHAAHERQRIAALEAKREATYRANLEMLEGRRQAMLARERKMEDILRQREELRQLQLQIKAEEDYLRDHQRRTIKAKAERDLEGRLATFAARNTAKDEYAARRKQELEHLRKIRADELRQRFDYIAAQANEAAAVAHAERQALAMRLDDKAARGEALAGQRQLLLNEMAALRQAMQRQEEVLRASLLRMRQKGSVALPEEVVRSLEAFQTGGPVKATTLLGGPRGSPGRLPGAAPRLALPAVPAEEALAAGAFAGTTIRRPRSAAVTPRTPAGAGGYGRGGAAATGRPGSTGPGQGQVVGERSYLTAMLSPRVGQPGKARRMAAAQRPLSASADFRRSADARPLTSPATPTRPGAGAAPTPYAPYTLPQARSRGRQPTVEEQVAEMTKTSDAAAEAAASRRYSGVHEVARPGSRREEELRAVLQEEIAKEGERQAMLAKVADDTERARLVKYFTLEREEAKRRILALSNAAQAALYH
ncbi:hypothetical protein CHLRE_17g737200v5 [Chlamydomonas reinhardtii]|uniref:Uncharacterized protein n=1 Tax=Chlamydomonas reinhardtii TaxID=3055 RepID=A0A2K3CRH1_CHLRE|nr:uncharacterized protein CHLRE_17g737200v5 [Chlamydomonas reinhardtii]PNW70877.1 hypothetical protein CHLRE_17g737200v5 [Chlamydomonas reinhardtii]